MVLNSTDPNSITTSYVELAAQFGGLVEVSSVYRNQKLPIYVRAAPKVGCRQVIDKNNSIQKGFIQESNIDDSNGLKTLIADILELGQVENVAGSFSR